jgi:hypothetical protein
MAGCGQTIEDGTVRIRRKTAVVVQTHQLTTVRLRHPLVRAWCAQCNAEVVMCSPEEAVVIAQSSVRDIYRRVETSELHSVNADDGDLRVCLNSMGETTIGGLHDSQD